MDLLCSEMRNVCKVSSESLDCPRSWCSECQRSSLVDLSQQQSLFLTVDGLSQQEKEFGERCEGEGTCAASPSESCRLASFLHIFGGGRGVLVERGVPSFLRAAVWLWQF